MAGLEYYMCHLRLRTGKAAEVEVFHHTVGETPNAFRDHCESEDGPTLARGLSMCTILSCSTALCDEQD